MKTIVTLKSFEGHKGRSGKQGGSLPRNATTIKVTAPKVINKKVLSSYSQVKVSGTQHYAGKGYWILPDDSGIVDVSSDISPGTNDHVGFLAMTDPDMRDLAMNTFGLTSNDIKKLKNFYITGNDEDVDSIMDKFFPKGFIRVREFGNETDIESQVINNATLKRLQKLVDADKLHLTDKVVWGQQSSFGYVYSTHEEFMSAKYVIYKHAANGDAEISLKDFSEQV